MDDIYIIKVKENLTQLEKNWGKASVRFGLIGKGIRPNYQIEGKKNQVKTFSGINHKPHETRKFKKSNLTQRAYRLIELDLPKILDKISIEIVSCKSQKTGAQVTIIPEEIDSSEQYFEGASKTISVNIYERNSDARTKCIEKYGYKCVVCSFDFEKFYGSIGKKYIHVHHIIPLAEIKKEYQLDPLKDLVPLCPNCHAMIHRTQPTLTIQQLKEYLAENGKNT